MESLRVALRDWAWLTPLISGEIGLDELRDLGFDLEVDRVQTLPGLDDGNRYAVSESSLSRFAMEAAAGTGRRVGVPWFPMQAFRSRCVLVARDSTATTAADLSGARVGLTGWHDSGNVWTRDALAHDGAELDGIEWFAGALLPGAVEYDRLGPGRDRGDVHQLDGCTLVEALEDGELDAILTPFMPPALYGPDATVRHLYPAAAETELRYFDDRGFVPGIHLLTAAEGCPLPVVDAVVGILDASRKEWERRRRRMLDEPLLGADQAFVQQAERLADWEAPSRQRAMVEHFLMLQRDDGIVDTVLTPEALFPGREEYR